MHHPLGADRAGYYSTAPLEQTLNELVDFAKVNRCSPRLTVGAAHVRSSQMRYFDSRTTEIGARHVMASGALPPAFPAVRIDGELYWDGGILSNTPTEAVFEDNPRKNSLIFAVHMWNPMGPEPQSIWEVLHRQKDIQYSSRIASHISRQQQAHRMRHIINQLAAKLPDDVRNSAEVRELASYGCFTQMHVVRLSGAAARQREPHQGRRLHAVRHPAPLGSGLPAHQARAERGAVAGRVRSARGRDPARAGDGAAAGRGVIDRGRLSRQENLGIRHSIIDRK